MPGIVKVLTKKLYSHLFLQGEKFSKLFTIYQTGCISFILNRFIHPSRLKRHLHCQIPLPPPGHWRAGCTWACPPMTASSSFVVLLLLLKTQGEVEATLIWHKSETISLWHKSQVNTPVTGLQEGSERQDSGLRNWQSDFTEVNGMVDGSS